jgi:phosphate transport system substrate-binding protein
MAHKNEIPILATSFLITLGIATGGLWWLFKENQSQPASSSQPALQAPDTFSALEEVPTGLFRYGGSTTWAPIRENIDPIIQQTHSEFRLHYIKPISGTPGSGNGIKMLLNSQVAFAQSARPLKEQEYELAQARGYTLRQIPVAIDAIAITVNPELNVSGLTVQQLQDIYTGEITNWQEVGGPNLPIIPYSRRIQNEGTVEFFLENLINAEQFGSNVKYVDRTAIALRNVAANRGAIYYTSARQGVPPCSVKSLPIARQGKALVPPYQEPFVSEEVCREKRIRYKLNFNKFHNGEYPLTRRLFVIVKENGEVHQQVGKAYARLLLTDQGQHLIRQAGFANIR